MNVYDQTFDWVQSLEGRARFSGGIRGWDECGHETFAIELEGDVIYGEIARTFLPNQNDFNLQVVSFGYGARENVGIPNLDGPGPHAQGTFPPEYLRRVQSLVVQLVQAALRFTDRPHILLEYPNAHFQGKVIFPEGWTVGASAGEITLSGFLP